MAGGRRKWPGGQAGWKISWAENGLFKIDQEGDGISDRSMEEWGTWMDAQIEKKFGQRPPPLTASSLNFSRNELGDLGIQSLVDYLCKREIAVVTLKLFRNGISDAGARAMGRLMAQSREPVHEVHLSHNVITEQGACAIFEAIAQSKRYPFSSERAGHRDAAGMTPIWLRMEYNCVSWAAIDERLRQQQVRYCPAESRDGWGPKDQPAPMVCLHQTFRNQKVQGSPWQQEAAWQEGRLHAGHGAGLPRWPGHDALQHGYGEADFLAVISQATHALQSSRGLQKELAWESGAAAAPEEVLVEKAPLYVFLDGGALHRFMGPEEGLLTFRGLLNLCQQGHMMCTLPEDQPRPSGLGAVEERDRIILAITDDAIDDLGHVSSDWSRSEWLRTAPDSYLQRCKQWGFVEILETSAYTQLVTLCEGQQQEAARLAVPERTLKTLDFARLWERQIDSPGRVLFLTADQATQDFGAGLAAEAGGGRHVSVALVGELERRFATDRVQGGAELRDAACAKTSECETPLSARLLASLALPPAATDAKGDAAAEARQLRRELQDAMALVDSAASLLKDGRSAPEVTSLLEKMGQASRRWRALLHQKGGAAASGAGPVTVTI